MVPLTNSSQIYRGGDMALSRKDRADRSCWVYFLRCPDTMQVRYIGQTTNPRDRSKAHWQQRETSIKGEWVESLKSQGKRPVMDVVLGPLAYEDAVRCEWSIIVRSCFAGVKLLNSNADLGFKFDRGGRIYIVSNHLSTAAKKRRKRTPKNVPKKLRKRSLLTERETQ